jgi:magnesium-transporting ATPase (P-type)
MSIMPDSIYAVDGVNPLEILLYAKLASNADKKDDPIDKAIIKAFEDSAEAKELLKAGGYEQTDLIGFNPEVKRVIAFIDSNGGKKTIAKGIVAKCIDTTAGGEDSGEIQWKVEQAPDKVFQQTVKEKDQALSKAGYKVGFIRTRIFIKCPYRHSLMIFLSPSFNRQLVFQCVMGMQEKAVM